MRTNTIKAVLAMTEFFSFNTTPEEMIDILDRVTTLEDTERDREILRALSGELSKALKFVTPK